MDFKFTEKEQTFHDELTDFLIAELPAGWADHPVQWPHDYAHSPYRDPKDMEFHESFIKKIAEKGWLTISWPKEYGGQGFEAGAPGTWAISFCDEHDMHLHLRRTQSASMAFGNTEYHLEKVAQKIGL
jgi:alkylation response protein AidB-like acyl-CoA dehydrogenase